LVQPARSLAHSPLFQVMFAWQDAAKHKAELPELEAKPLQSSHIVSRFDLTLALHESGGRIEGGLEYATALFETETVERYLSYFTRLLQAMVADDSQTVDELLILGEDEQRRLDNWHNDDPVKIRGYRIDLGTIVERLKAHSGVREAVVVAREDELGEKRLVAYYTAAEADESGGSEPSAGKAGVEELRKHLLQSVPEYMVPAAYVRLERLPRTANGKPDHEALPAPEPDEYAVHGYEAPVGEIETALASIWADLTTAVRIGRHDNFFELGGHSLLVTRLVLRIYQQFGVKIDIPEVFEFAQLSSLSAQVRRAQFAEFDAQEFAQMMQDS
jgi:acyl carrier protein